MRGGTDRGKADGRSTIVDRAHSLPSPQTTLAQEQVIATELLLAMKSAQLKGLKRDWAVVAGASDIGIGVDDFLFLLSRHMAPITVAARMPQALLLAAMLDLFHEIDSMGSSSGLVEWSQFSRQLMHAAQVGDPAPLQASGGQGSGQGQEWVPSALRMHEVAGSGRASDPNAPALQRSAAGMLGVVAAAAGQRGRPEVAARVSAVNVAAMVAMPGTERLACTQHARYTIPHTADPFLLRHRVAAGVRRTWRAQVRIGGRPLPAGAVDPHRSRGVHVEAAAGRAADCAILTELC